MCISIAQAREKTMSAESGSGIFPEEIQTMALVKWPCEFPLRRLAQHDVRGIGVRHFSCEFPHKTGLVNCPCAFRLRRLAQNDVRGIGVRQFSFKIHTIALVKCPCEFRLRRLSVIYLFIYLAIKLSSYQAI